MERAECRGRVGRRIEIRIEAAGTPGIPSFAQQIGEGIAEEMKREARR
jgi:hypothetical protein